MKTLLSVLMLIFLVSGIFFPINTLADEYGQGGTTLPTPTPVNPTFTPVNTSSDINYLEVAGIILALSLTFFFFSKYKNKYLQDS